MKERKIIVSKLKFFYLLIIVLLWAGWVTAFFLLKDWDYFKAIVLIFIAVAEGFIALSLILLNKALKA